MKNIISAGSAVALGVASVIAPLVASPATAVGTAAVCDPGEVQETSGDFNNWYQSCVPQFGLGKVEFTISSETDFPADFKDLTDPAVNVTTTTDLDLLNLYLDSSDVDSPFLGLSRTDDGSNPKLQQYEAITMLTSSEMSLAAFKIAAVSELSPAEAPAACDAFLDVGESYPRVFSVTFEPLDVTFSQNVNGQEWIYRVVMAPGTQYVAGTLPAGEDAWEQIEPLCVSQGTYIAGGSSGSQLDDPWSYAAFMTNLVAPYSSNDGLYVADYPRTASPELPATGLNTLLPLGVGALTLVVGGLAVSLRRHRS